MPRSLPVRRAASPCCLHGRCEAPIVKNRPPARWRASAEREKCVASFGMHRRRRAPCTVPGRGSPGIGLPVAGAARMLMDRARASLAARRAASGADGCREAVTPDPAHRSQPMNSCQAVSHVSARGALMLLLLLCTAAAAAVHADGESPGNGAWQNMRPNLYGTRAISEMGDDTMSIEAPASSPDPSATPVVVHFGESMAGKIKQVRVIIDNNPSPLATTMNLKEGLPVNEIDLRVRIDRFTSVRAIAETTDGKLEMRSTWVNASGGCSAPPSAAQGGTLGQIRFRPSGDAKSLQISIRHPNNSGFQIDPRTGDAIPPHFVSHIRLSAGGETLMEADTGISLSENPTLRIASSRSLSSPITVEATDLPTQERYTGTWTADSSAQ